MKDIAVVTGASSGLGYKFAYKIARDFDIDEIWLIARRKENLIELGHQIYDDFGVNVVVIPVDLTVEKSFDKIQKRLEKVKPRINILVNCSGFGLIGQSFDLDFKAQQDMIKLNCLALFNLTDICLNYMTRGSGIIQISSAAAFCPQPNFAVYAATKSFVFSYSIALNYELKKHGIKVCTVCYGPVDTPFFDVAESGEKKMCSYKKLFMKNADYVVNKSIEGYVKGKSLVIPSVTMKLFAALEGVHFSVFSAYVASKFYNDRN